MVVVVLPLEWGAARNPKTSALPYLGWNNSPETRRPSLEWKWQVPSFWRYSGTGKPILGWEYVERSVLSEGV